MRKIWHSTGWGGRLLRLSFVVLSFFGAFLMVAQGFLYIGASPLDAHRGASIVAMVSAAFVLYA